MPHLNPMKLPFVSQIKKNLSFSQVPAAKKEPKVDIPLAINSEAKEDKLSFGVQGSASTSVSLEPKEKEPQFIEHKVKRGETLGKIAKQHMGDFDKYMEVFEANRDTLRNPNGLRIGMTIRVPVPAKAKQEEVSFPTPNPKKDVAPKEAPVAVDKPPKAVQSFKEHTVKRGESLSIIALRELGNSDRYMEIFDANRDILKSPDALGRGMKLRIPVEGAKVEVTPPTVKPAKPEVTPPLVGPPAPPKVEAKPVEPAKPAPAAMPEHRVRSGESLSIIAKRELGDASRYREIFEANRDQLSDPGDIQVGMMLKIPGGTARPVVDTAAVINAEGLNDGAKELLGAMQRYQQHHARLGNTQRTKTTPAQMREIAYELDRASTAFGVDPKMMLALYAHESGGINPRAKSHTGAGGLGQLTGIAIEQVHFLAGMARGQRGKSPYTQHQDKFVQHKNRINQRYNIKANVWTSTAYMSYELNDRARLGRGVEKALKRYGDPHVSTYANKVNAEHRTLFGSSIF